MYQINVVRAVTKDCGGAWRNSSRNHSAEAKQMANQRFRTRFRAICKRLRDDPESFWDEPFNLPQTTGWDID